MFQGEVFIVEFVAVDGLSAAAISRGEVTALSHKVGDDSVECAALVC